jgi:hypothetical protein
MDKVFGGGLWAKPPEAGRFLLFINWFMVVGDIVFGWKKYRTVRSGKDDRHIRHWVWGWLLRDAAVGSGAMRGLGQSPHKLNSFWLLKEW